VIYGADRFVAYGDDGLAGGAVLTSPDGLQWIKVAAGLTREINALAYGKGIFVAVGYNGSVITSPDAATWLPQKLGASAHLHGVSFLGGLFVAVGESGSLFTSPNGQDWLPQVSGTSTHLYGVTFGHGTYVAVGGFDYLKGAATVLTSPDARVWSVATVKEAYGLRSVAFDGRIFAAVSMRGEAVWSPDARAWIVVDNLTYNELNSVTSGADHFVAVGGSTVIRSLSPSSWETVIDGVIAPKAIAQGNGLFIAAGSGALLQSTDGVSWRRLNVPGPLSQGAVQDILFAQGIFVAAGDLGRLMTSEDGLQWTQRYSGMAATGFTGVAFGGGSFIAVTDMGIGGSLIYRSEDGLQWTAVGSGGMGSFRAVTYGDGVFVAAGDAGLLMSSTNGTTWRMVPNVNSTLFFRALAFGNHHFVAAAARAGALLVSDNGIDWNASGASTESFPGVAFGNGWFVAVDGYGQLRASRTGDFWRPCAPIAASEITSISSVPGRLFALGKNTILNADWSGSPSLQAISFDSSGFQMTVRAQTKRPLELQGRTDLAAAWTPVLSFTNSQETAVISDIGVSGLARRFYRIRQTDLAPEALAGQSLTVKIRDGSGILSSTGVYRFTALATGNRYTLTPLSGPISADSGSYGYRKTGADTATLTMTNQLGWVLSTSLFISTAKSGDGFSEVQSGNVGRQYGDFEIQ